MILGTNFSRVPGFINPCIGHAIIHYLSLLPTPLGDPFLFLDWAGSCWDISKIFTDKFFCGCQINITSQSNHCVVGPIVCLKPFFHIVQCCCTEILHRSYSGPRIRMAFGKCCFCCLEKNLSIGPVFTLSLFILDDTGLIIESILINHAKKMAHPVRFHPQGKIESGCWNILKIIGSVVVGCSIHVGSTDLLKRTKVFIVVIFCAIKHQMFKQMSKTCFSGFLVLGSYVIPNIDSNDGYFMVFMHQHSQTIG